MMKLREMEKEKAAWRNGVLGSVVGCICMHGITSLGEVEVKRSQIRK